MVIRWMVFGAVVAGTYAWPGGAVAATILHLRNGSQVTVESYREEGDWIVYDRFGGTVRVPRVSIERIEGVDHAPPVLDRSDTAIRQEMRGLGTRIEQLARERDKAWREFDRLKSQGASVDALKRMKEIIAENERRDNEIASLARALDSLGKEIEARGKRQ